MDTVESENRLYPSSEEVRMARAIALSVVAEAALRGESQVAFRGFRINAVRTLRGHGNDIAMRVELLVAFNGHIIDREIAEVLPLHCV